MQLLARAHNKALIHIICQERCLRQHRVNIISTRAKRCLIRQRCAPPEGSRGRWPLRAERREVRLEWGFVFSRYNGYSDIHFYRIWAERLSDRQQHFLREEIKDTAFFLTSQVYVWDLQELSGCYSVKQVEEKSTFNKPDSSLFVCFFSYTVVSFCDSYIENKSERQCVYKVCCHLAFIHWNWTWAQSAGHHICIKPW